LHFKRQVLETRARDLSCMNTRYGTKVAHSTAITHDKSSPVFSQINDFDFTSRNSGSKVGYQLAAPLAVRCDGPSCCCYNRLVMWPTALQQPFQCTQGIAARPFQCTSRHCSDTHIHTHTHSNANITDTKHTRTHTSEAPLAYTYTDIHTKIHAHKIHVYTKSTHLYSRNVHSQSTHTHKAHTTNTNCNARIHPHKHIRDAMHTHTYSHTHTRARVRNATQKQHACTKSPAHTTQNAYSQSTYDFRKAQCTHKGHT
jgi:hypothetical protein